MNLPCRFRAIRRSVRQGVSYLQTTIDDHSRLAGSEILANERKGSKRAHH
ncbi:hypothetical protein ACH4UM_37590 [Streptomyces sp. NPDC020801]